MEFESEVKKCQIKSPEANNKENIRSIVFAPFPGSVLLVTETILQVMFGNLLGPDFDGFLALDVYQEATRTFSQASTRF